MPPVQYDGARQEFNPDQAGMMDDTEDPELELTATEDVYSYFMFIAPTEEKKRRHKQDFGHNGGILVGDSEFDFSGYLTVCHFLQSGVEDITVAKWNHTIRTVIRLVPDG